MDESWEGFGEVWSEGSRLESLTVQGLCLWLEGSGLRPQAQGATCPLLGTHFYVATGFVTRPPRTWGCSVRCALLHDAARHRPVSHCDG